jgi:hypothetical protein
MQQQVLTRPVTTRPSIEIARTVPILAHIRTVVGRTAVRNERGREGETNKKKREKKDRKQTLFLELGPPLSCSEAP